MQDTWNAYPGPSGHPWREAQKPIGVALGLTVNVAVPWWVMPAIGAIGAVDSSDYFIGWVLLAMSVPVGVGLALTGRETTHRFGVGLFAGAVTAAVVDGLMLALMLYLIFG